MSAEAKHTPGPWTWTKERTGKNWEAPWLVGADGAVVLDYRGCGSHDYDGTKDDLALIACAPELLAAVKSAESSLRLEYGEKCTADLRSLIAKAEGKEP